MKDNSTPNNTNTPTPSTNITNTPTTSTPKATHHISIHLPHPFKHLAQMYHDHMLKKAQENDPKATVNVTTDESHTLSPVSKSEPLQQVSTTVPLDHKNLGKVIEKFESTVKKHSPEAKISHTIGNGTHESVSNNSNVTGTDEVLEEAPIKVHATPPSSSTISSPTTTSTASSSSAPSLTLTAVAPVKSSSSILTKVEQVFKTIGQELEKIFKEIAPDLQVLFTTVEGIFETTAVNAIQSKVGGTVGQELAQTVKDTIQNTGNEVNQELTKISTNTPTTTTPTTTTPIVDDSVHVSGDTSSTDHTGDHN
jgi:hypothetical protein